MQSGLNDDEALQKMIKFLDKDKAVHANGKIDASEVLLMVQKIRAGEVTPRVQVELINEPSTLEI